MIILKILLWILRIILIVLAVLAVAFAIPVGVCFIYDDKPKLWVKYLFLKIPIDLEPNEEKQKKKDLKEEKKKQKEQLKSQKKKEKNSSEKKDKKNIVKETKKQEVRETKRKIKKEKEPKKENKILKKIKSLWKKGGLEGIVELIKELAKIAGGLLACVFKHILIKKLDLYITVAYEDAADTATNYGYTCAGVYPAMAIILRVFKYKDYNVIITPDFDKKKTEIYVDAQLDIVPWFVVVGVLEALVKFLKMKAKGLI